jgi:sodium-dependent phosphate cotransporter
VGRLFQRAYHTTYCFSVNITSAPQANIGTTVTAIMAAMVSDNVESLQVALAHLMFNITGIVIWYPVPFMRNIPLTAARKLGRATRLWRGFPLVYIGVMFFLLPLVMLGLSALYEQKSAAFTTLAVLLTLVVAFAILYLIYWCRCAGGMEKCQNCMVARQRRKEYEKALPDDMEYVKQRLEALAEHTGLPEEEDDDSDDDDDDDDYYQEDEKDVETGDKAYEDDQDEQEEIAA